MIIIFSLLIFLLFPGSAHSQEVSSLNPDEVVKLIKDHRLEGLKKVWKGLGIESELFRKADPQNVERLDKDFDGREGIEVLITISDLNKQDWQYLIFSIRGGNWYFLGSIDLSSQTNRPPWHRIERQEPQTSYIGTGPGWLVIEFLEASKNGLFVYKERWWDLSGNKLQMVLEYPVKGRVRDRSLVFDRDFGSEALGFDQHPSNEFRVYLAFWAMYFDGRDRIKTNLDDILFSVAKIVVYVWDSTQGRFVIDPQLSDMTGEQVEGLYADDSNRFLKHNLDELKKLASSKDESKRVWLKRFLEDCSDGPDKTALLELLR